MKIKEIIRQLQQFPEDTQVLIFTDNDLSLVDTITFKLKKDLFYVDDCVILEAVQQLWTE